MENEKRNTIINVNLGGLWSVAMWAAIAVFFHGVTRCESRSRTETEKTKQILIQTKSAQSSAFQPMTDDPLSLHLESNVRELPVPRP
jgi:hypothetical protein